MDSIAKFAEGLMGVFNFCAETFVGNLVGLVPLVLILLTFFNTIIAAIGEKRIEKFTCFLSKNRITAYVVLPIISWILLSCPMAFSTGKFLPPRMKAGYFEAAAHTSIWLLCFFPHVNPGEYFIWGGIAQGAEAIGYNLYALGTRLAIVYIIVALIQSLLAEYIWTILANREGRTDLIEANQI